MIEVPIDGRPAEPPGSDCLVGVDGNVFSIIGAASKLLRRAGASSGFVAAFRAEATSGTYDHAIAAAIAYLDASS